MAGFAGSHQCTYAMAAMSIKNERWDGVPFILRCGKGMCLLNSAEFVASPFQRERGDLTWFRV